MKTKNEMFAVCKIGMKEGSLGIEILAISDLLENARRHKEDWNRIFVKSGKWDECSVIILDSKNKIVN